MASTSSLDTEIRSRIETFLAEISAMVRQSALSAVREAFGDGSAVAPARRGPGRPAKSVTPQSAPRARRRRGGKRSSEEVDAMAGRLLAYVKEHPGQGVEAIAKGLRLSSKELKLPVIKLVGAKSLRTTGQRRGTRYFAGASGRAGGRGNGRKAKAQPRRTAKGIRKGAAKKARRRQPVATTQTASIAAAA